MKLSLLIVLIAALSSSFHSANRKGDLTKKKPLAPASVSSAQAVVVINSQNAGPTPFIAEIHLTVAPANSLQKISFKIAPKPGSVTRAVSATYSTSYLQSRGYLNLGNGQVTVPVFGLYGNYSNTVTLTSLFIDGSSQQDTLTVPTGQFSNACWPNSPTALQARTNHTDLSYDYIMVRSFCSTQSPIIIDTDGAVRWVGTAGVSDLSSMLFENGIYVSSFPPSSSSQSGITRMEFDGTYTFIRDYSDIGVTYSGHHTYDPGKEGMLIEVDTTTQLESVILEVDACGNVLKRWDFADIISAAMVAGGDNPSLFVTSPPGDWFHMNAATYRKSDNSLIVSSRENFVICIDYDTSAIKWILGDSTKQWYTQFPSLRQYALTLGPNTLPPIGQHAVSITYDDHLLLFDNGRNSLHHTPAGTNRAEAVPRKYRIDTQANVATEVWNFPNSPTVSSPFCSSIYEDGPLNYLVDYAMVGGPGGNPPARILGLNAAGTKIFDYQYANTGCSTAWNSVPIHFENMQFTGPDPADTPTGWQITSFTRRGNVSVIGFRGLANETYRVEYKDSLTDPTWQTVVDRAFQCTGAAVVEHPTAANHPDRVYRVRLLP